MKTYEAYVEDGAVTWIGDPPPLSGRVRLRMRIVPEPGSEPNGAKLGRLIDDYLARTGGLTTIDDPVAWQREQRIDRPLPGRE